MVKLLPSWEEANPAPPPRHVACSPGLGHGHEKDGEGAKGAYGEKEECGGEAVGGGAPFDLKLLNVPEQQAVAKP
jgi:hypothetical protein